MLEMKILKFLGIQPRYDILSRQFKSEAQKESMQENHITNANQKAAQNGMLPLPLETFLKEVLWNKRKKKNNQKFWLIIKNKIAFLKISCKKLNQNAAVFLMNFHNFKVIELIRLVESNFPKKLRIFQ